MLIHEGDSRSSRIDILLAVILAFIAGAVNSAGYYSFGYFSANMTGNVSLISDHLSLWQVRIALAFISILFMFILGSFCASLFIGVGRRNHQANIYALTLLAEAFLLVMIGILDLVYRSELGGIVIVSLLSFTMGIQNAASTRISGSKVRTTHVSGIATDIGVGLAALLQPLEMSVKIVFKQRLQLHLATIVSFTLGGIAGVLAYQMIGGMMYWCAAFLLFLLSAKYVGKKAI